MNAQQESGVSELVERLDELIARMYVPQVPIHEWLFFPTLLIVAPLLVSRPAWAAAPRPNVLFIAINDR
ncbi:MAG: hypothetical protein FJ276_23215 [Planctomycetes bacterium]|nr:hypothetical protein [Planctomycetota bacterium]